MEPELASGPVIMPAGATSCGWRLELVCAAWGLAAAKLEPLLAGPVVVLAAESLREPATEDEADAVSSPMSGKRSVDATGCHSLSLRAPVSGPRDAKE